MNRVAIEEGNVEVSEHAQSMGGDDQQHLEFNVKMGQSITNSVAGQSDSNNELLSPNNEEDILAIAGQPDNVATQARENNNRSGMNQTQNTFHPLNVQNPGVISSDGLMNFSEVKPPKTADGQKRRKKRTSPSENMIGVDGENDGYNDGYNDGHNTKLPNRGDSKLTKNNFL